MLDEQLDYLYQALGIDRLSEQLCRDEHPWASTVAQQIRSQLSDLNHGDITRWLALLRSLPEARNISARLDLSEVSFSSNPVFNKHEKQKLLSVLQGLKPWRKGPYNLFGINIDTEWRSDLKWKRIAAHLDLENKTILDVGCANGYFGWRMLGAGARSVVGIDPSWLFIIQFALVNHYARQVDLPGSFTLLPKRMEELPDNLEYFDWVFSMGVLYHRRSPFDHLFELKSALRPGGKLLLETLVIPETWGQVLVPRDRYARMRNVWFIPSTRILCDWLERAGFIDIQTLDESSTTIEEQRKTDWLISESLEHCLAPGHTELTVEGHPAPRRAIVLARRPR